jgi:hypothetical protein
MEKPGRDVRRVRGFPRARPRAGFRPVFVGRRALERARTVRFRDDGLRRAVFFLRAADFFRRTVDFFPRTVDFRADACFLRRAGGFLTMKRLYIQGGGQRRKSSRPTPSGDREIG